MLITSSDLLDNLDSIINTMSYIGYICICVGMRTKRDYQISYKGVGNRKMCVNDKHEILRSKHLHL